MIKSACYQLWSFLEQSDIIIPQSMLLAPPVLIVTGALYAGLLLSPCKLEVVQNVSPWILGEMPQICAICLGYLFDSWINLRCQFEHYTAWSSTMQTFGDDWLQLRSNSSVILNQWNNVMRIEWSSIEGGHISLPTTCLGTWLAQPH